MIDNCKLKEKVLTAIPLTVLFVILLGILSISVFAYETQDNNFGQHYTANLRDYTGYTSNGGIALYNLALNPSGTLEDQWGSSDGTRNNGQNGVVCDGVDDYINTTLKGNAFNKNLTINIWFNSTFEGVNSEIIESQPSSGNYFQLIWDNDASDRIIFEGGGLGSSSLRTGASINISENNLDNGDIYLMSIVREFNENIKFYIDGVLVNSTNIYSNNSAEFYNNKNTLICKGSVNEFQGNIYNITFSNYVMSDTEIQEVYEKNKPETRSAYVNTDGLVAGYLFALNQNSDDISGNGNDGTDTNVNYIGTGANINGDGNIESSSDFYNGNNVSWGMKFSTNNLPKEFFILANDIDSTSELDFGIWSNKDTSNLYRCSGFNGAGTEFQTSGQVLNYNEINTFYCVYDGTKIKEYINGVNTDNSSTFTMRNIGTGLNIGSWASTNFGINGTINNIMIFNRSLSNEEILALNNSGSFVNDKQGESNKAINLTNAYIYTELISSPINQTFWFNNGSWNFETNNSIFTTVEGKVAIGENYDVIDEVRMYNRSLSPEEIHNIEQEYDKTDIEVTSNLPDLGVQRENFEIDINYSGIDGSVQCGVYDNTTNLSCPIQNGVAGQSTVICQLPDTLVFEDVNLKPYCANSSIEYWSQDYDITLLNARLNVSATAGIGGAPINDIYVMVDNITYQQTGANTYAYGAGTKEVRIWADGYAYEYRNITFTTDLQNLSVTLYEDTLIRVSTYDINGNALNDTNITFSKTGYSFDANTGADNIYYNTFTEGNYTITVSRESYSDSDYFVTLNNGSYILLNTYLDLEEDTFSRTFTVKRSDNSNNVQDALLSFYRTINGSQTLVTQVYSDYNGQALAFLDATQEYLLRVSHPIYLSKEISFTPTDASYVVYIGEGYVPEYETVYDDVSYNILPTYNILYQGNFYDFNFSISSSQGQLEYWGLSVDNNGVVTTKNITGQPSGSNTNINVFVDANTTAYIPVTVRYFFKSGAQSEEWNMERTYWAYPDQISNNTIVNAFDEFSAELSPNGKTNYVQYIIMAFTTIALMGLLMMVVKIRSFEIIGTIIVSLFAFWCKVGWFEWWLWGLIAVPIYILTIVKLSRGS